MQLAHELTTLSAAPGSTISTRGNIQYTRTAPSNFHRTRDTTPESEATRKCTIFR